MFKKSTLLSYSALALIVLTACGGQSDSSTESSASTSSSATVAATACERPSSNSTTLTAAPAVDRWVSWGSTMRPVSQKYGGEQTGEHGSPSCFEHSPEGALFASSTYLGSVFSPEEFRQVALDHIHPAADAQTFYDSWLEQAEDTYDMTFEPVAYRLESYTADEAMVAIVLGNDDRADRYLVIRLPLIWADGDWQINTGATDNSELYANLAEFVTSLEGYTVWGPDTAPSASASASAAG